MSRINVPPGHVIRLSLRASAYFVIVGPEDEDATPERLHKPGCVTALFTHDRGLNWPAEDGPAKADAYLRAGWTVCFQFESLADAMACRDRLVRERAQ